MKVLCGLMDESYKYQYGIELQDESEIFKPSEISLVSGRRDWVAFQLLIKSDEDFALSVGNRPVFSPKGPLPNIRVKCKLDGFPDAIIKMYPIGLIEDDDRIYKADLLLDDEVVDVDKGKIQPVWIEISILEDTKPGVYKGEVNLYAQSMFEDEQNIKTFNFTLTVKNVLLHKPKDFNFHLDLWQHLSNIARKHKVHLWSNEHFEVIEKYVKSLADLGQKAITIIASEIPWSGQRCFRVKNYPSDLFEYNMARIEKDETGRYIYDLSVIERYVNMCFSYGIDREIEIFGLINIWTDSENGYDSIVEDYPDAIRIRYYNRADGCYKYMRTANEIKDYIKALEQFFIKKGWIEKVRIVADEPGDTELYYKRLKLLKKIAPTFKFKAAINHPEFIDRFKDEIDDFVPILPCVCEKWEELEKLKEQIKGRFLWYVCCWPPRPNTFISSPLLESRLIGILTAFINFDGFLRWNYTVWPEKPRERLSYRYPHWKAGDTNFVYPSWNGGPIFSLRYKNLKRGIEDFELISMLKKTRTDSQLILEKIWDKIFRTKNIIDFSPSYDKRAEELYSLDYADYQAFRTALLEALEE